MTKRKQYTRFFCLSKVFILRFYCYAVLRSFMLVAFLFFLQPIKVGAQDMFTGESVRPFLIYDKLPVTVYLEANLSFDIDVILIGKDSMYVNVEDLFKKLTIPCIVSNYGNKMEGFIENENTSYLIDFDTKQIRVGNRIIYPYRGLVQEMGSLYLESQLLADAFGITMTINLRSLDVKLQSTFELPLVRQMRIEKTRMNISKLRGEQIVADTLVKRNYHLFKFGTMDWSAASYQTWNEKNNNRFGLGIGTELLYGEANISAYYDDQYKFDNRQINYLWRWIDNDKKIIKQAEAGKISTQSIAFLRSPVVGVSIKNTPNTLRKASGFYPVNGVTEPNWTVELYINDILVDYVNADASGLYLFSVPIVYGYTKLKLKFYGPLGEERTEERTINIPYSILPANESEYSLSAGVLQDRSSSRFAKGELNYGISRTLTLGGGMEYLSSIATGAYIPYIKGTFQPFSGLIVNGEYASGVRSRGLLSYYFGKNTLLEVDYDKYDVGQKATLSNAPVERKIRLSVPIKIKRLNGYAKMEYRQFVYSEFTFNYGSLILSAFYKQFSASSSTLLNWTDNARPYITSDLALSFRFRKGFVFRPSVSYNVSDKKFIRFKAEVEKRFRYGYFNVAYEKNIYFNQDYITVGLKYDLPFARMNFSVSKNQGKIMTSESAQGSLAFGGSDYTHLSNNSSLSKGGILLYPFLDVNQNGVFDKGEHPVKLNTVRINGGRAIFSEKDSIVRIPDLNAFTNYILELKDEDLETMSWRFKNKIYSILVDPNQFKRVDIPVISVGEVSGMTYMDRNGEMKGLGRIIIKFYDKNSHIEVAQTLSESDGYIYFLGLGPGDYIVCVDSAQLLNLRLTVDPPCREFNIKTAEDGDIVEGLDFILRQAEDDFWQSQNSTEKQGTESTDTNDSLVLLKGNPEKLTEEKEVVSKEIVKINKSSHLKRIDQQNIVSNGTGEFLTGDTLYKVQLLALPRPIKDQEYFTKLINDIPGLIIEETLGEDGLFHYSTKAFKGIAEAAKYQRLIRKTGWKDSFVAKYAGQMRTEKLYRIKLHKSPGQIQQKNSVKQKAVQNTEVSHEEIAIPRDQQNISRLDGLNIASLNAEAHLPGKISVEVSTFPHLAGDPLYKVQLITLRAPIRVKGYFSKLLNDVPGLTIEELQGVDGLYHYSTGAFSRIFEAREIQLVIAKSGWKDCYISFYTSDKLEEKSFRTKQVK